MNVYHYYFVENNARMIALGEIGQSRSGAARAAARA